MAQLQHFFVVLLQHWPVAYTDEGNARLAQRLRQQSSNIVRIVSMMATFFILVSEREALTVLQHLQKRKGLRDQSTTYPFLLGT